MANTCAHHPERPAHALCMSCQRAVCQECATTWEGINYCAPCLERRRRRSAKRSTPWAGWVLVLGAAAGLFWVVTRLMVWAGVLVADVF